jgi:hypothetical protein
MFEGSPGGVDIWIVCCLANRFWGQVPAYRLFAMNK